jgi:hypothetical protein
MNGPSKTFRRRMIEAQHDRNYRMRKLTKGARKRVRKLARAMFCCRACDREVSISWEKLSGESGTPKCEHCGGTLLVVTACLSKGVLPKAR